MKIIESKHGQVLLDEEDYNRILEDGFHFSVSRHRENSRYVYLRKMIDYKNIQYSLHRYILNITNPGIQVDHINGNGLDNRKCNLRIATSQQNSFNRKKNRRTKSIYKGVFWEKERNNWRAIIGKDYETYKLGRFENEIDAARAYDQAAIRLFGQFAKLNFPNEDYVSLDLNELIRWADKMKVILNIKFDSNKFSFNVEVISDMKNECFSMENVKNLVGFIKAWEENLNRLLK